MSSLLAILLSAALVQAPKTTETLVGEVLSVDVAARRLTAKADAGGQVLVVVPEGASLLRAQPGATSLAAATPLALESIAAGDRVMVRGAFSEDRSVLEARQLVVIAREDIARKNEEERAEWRRRGILGSVTAVDPGRGEIAVRLGRWAGAETLVLRTAGRTVAFRRYAPDSVRFADARPSGLADVRVGDELRALGDRSPDAFLPDQVVFGSFRIVAGTVAAVDPARGEVVVRDDGSKRVTVTVGPDARVRRLPQELAERLARRRERDESATAPEGPERTRWGRESASGPEELLDRLPPSTVADLKVGDRIMASSTRGSDEARVNAIAVVTGLAAVQSASGPGSRSRQRESDLPPELLDLGLSLP